MPAIINDKSDFCRHFKKLYQYLKRIPELLLNVYDDWHTSVKEYEQEWREKQHEIEMAMKLKEKAKMLAHNVKLRFDHLYSENKTFHGLLSVTLYATHPS